MKLTLASTSERRQELLAWIIEPFDLVDPAVEEKVYPDEEISEVVARLAIAKARAAVKQLEGKRVFGSDEDTGLILAADTLVGLDGKIFGKPVNREEALEMMKTFSGKTHEVWTGVCVWDGDTGEERVEVEQSLVIFHMLTNEQIEKFLDTKEWEGKAGGYMIQGAAAAFVREVKGSFTNVVGLPLVLVQDMLESMGCPTAVEVRNIIHEKTGYGS